MQQLRSKQHISTYSNGSVVCPPVVREKKAPRYEIAVFYWLKNNNKIENAMHIWLLLRVEFNVKLKKKKMSWSKYESKEIFYEIKQIKQIKKIKHT